MSDPRTDVETVNNALRHMAERAASDPDYRARLKANQVEELRSAGLSAFALSGAFAEEGAEEEEVAAFGLSVLPMSGAAGTGGDRIVVSNTCVGTCGKYTITVCCTHSFA